MKNPKIEELQRDIANKQTALRAILEAEHKAAQALVAETEEALAVLGGKAPVQTLAPAPTDKGRVGSRPAVRAALRRLGAMTAGEVSVVAKVSRGAASGALFRLVTDGEVTRTLSPGRKRDAVYELTAKGV